MTQREPGPSHRNSPRGPQAWIAPLVLGVVSLVLVAALVWFIVVAWTLRARIAVPAWVIPASMVVAALVAVRLFLRAIRNIGVARRWYRNRPTPPAGRS